MQDFLFHTHKQMGPHLTTAKKHSLKAWAQSKKHGWKAWLASKKHTNAFLSSPQVNLLPGRQCSVSRLRLIIAALTCASLGFHLISVYVAC